MRSVPMRMEMKEGINQSYIVDDTYNNDLGGLELSLQWVRTQEIQVRNPLTTDVGYIGLTYDIAKSKKKKKEIAIQENKQTGCVGAHREGRGGGRRDLCFRAVPFFFSIL